MAAQTQHEQAARTNPEQRASVNHGTPAVAATPKPGAFSDRAVVHAKQTGAPYNAPVNRAAVQPPVNAPVAHPEKMLVARIGLLRIISRSRTVRRQHDQTSRSQTSRNRAVSPQLSRNDSPSRIVRR